MASPRTDQIAEIFHEAVEIPDPGQRERYLLSACGGDDLLAEVVRRLIAADAETKNGILEDPAPWDFPPIVAAADHFRPEQAGDRIDNFTLVRQLGEGGFGTVWLADQMDPIKRRVALKIMKPGMDTRDAIKRFEQERQALALMDHPNIAKVYAAGATERGRLYFAMELVEGDRITEHCDKSLLSIEERLDLYIPVCLAVQHAHQKGVIHRDLKPSNILVALQDGKAVPKIIDFGIAKAIEGRRLIGETAITESSQVVGTPLYMSPEQAESGGVATDTRSDVYSLGMVLYEVLSGALPFSLKHSSEWGGEELRRMIRDEDPRSMSETLGSLSDARLAEIARRRKTTGARLIASLAKDLNWICLKSLEKERARRYSTASALADDLQRYLAHEPVTAVAPSTSYKLEKFVRRNRLAVTFSLAIFFLLVASVAVSSWEAMRASRAEKQAKRRWELILAQSAGRQHALQRVEKEEDEAKEARLDTEALADFWFKRVLSAAQPKEIKGGLGVNVTVVGALEEAGKNVEADFAGQPRAECLALYKIGQAWLDLHDFEPAARFLRRAVELRERIFGLYDLDTLDCRNAWATALIEGRRFSEGRSIADENLLRLCARYGVELESVGDFINTSACSYSGLGEFKTAIQLFELAVAKNKAILGSQSRGALESMRNLAIAYCNDHRLGSAIPLMEETCRRANEYLGENDPDALKTTICLARLYIEADDTAKGVPLMEEALGKYTREFGNQDSTVLEFAVYFEKVCEDFGDHDRAQAIERTYFPDSIRSNFKEQLQARSFKKGEVAYISRFPASSLAMTNDGKFVYAVVVGELSIFGRDVNSGYLNHVVDCEIPETAADGKIRLSSDNRYLVLASPYRNSVAIFERDFSTGRLRALDHAREGQGGAKGLQRVSDASFSKDNRYLYTAGKNGIGVYKFDDRRISFVDYQDDGGRLQDFRCCCVSPDDRWVYAAVSRTGLLVVMKRDEQTGGLTVIQSVGSWKDNAMALNGIMNVSVSPDGKNVYTVGGRYHGENVITAFSVGADGRLTSRSRSVNGENDLAKFEGGDQVAVSSDGKTLLATASISNRLFQFDRDPTTGSLTLADSWIVTPNSVPGAGDLCISPDGTFAYVVDEEASSVAIFRFGTGSSNKNK